MTSSARIYKSSTLINNNLDIVKINDDVKLTKEVHKSDESALSSNVTNKSPDKVKEVTLKEQLLMEASKKDLENKVKNAHDLVEEAKKEATLILEKASQEALKIKERIIAEANQSAKQMQAQGYQEGFMIKEKEILELIKYMNEVLKETQSNLKQSEDEFVNEVEKEVRFFALDIAKKILAKEIETDQLALSCIVLELIDSLKKDDRISVTLSNKATKLIEMLQKEFSENSKYINRNISVESANTPVDSISIEHQMGLIDASISTQIQILEDLFNKY